MKKTNTADWADGAADLSLAALRSEIDHTDDALLELIEKRQGLARRVNAFKATEPAGLALRPDREAFVLNRLLGRVDAARRPLVQSLWREVLSAGLAAQGELTVATWAPNAIAAEMAARLRFGASARYRPVGEPEQALDAAEQGNAVAVLWLDREHPWWAEIVRRESLWVFEALPGLRGRDEPAALAVGRIPTGALARGLAFRVSAGGDSGEGPTRERVIATAQGLRLYASPEASDAGPLDRERGYIGCAPREG
jgi:chorismate mutase